MENIPCSYTGRNNIMKMAIPPKLKYRVNALPFKFFMAYFICLDKKYKNSYGMVKDHKQLKQS